MSSLYELNKDFMLLQFMMEDEVIDEETFKDTLESIEMSIEDKAEGYAIVMQQLSDEANSLDKESKRLKAKEAVIKNNVDRLKMSLFDSMELTGKTKFKTKLFSFNIRTNGGSTLIPDESLIPKKYLIAQPSKIDRKAILDALKSGAKVKGASLKHSRSLIIK